MPERSGAVTMGGNPVTVTGAVQYIQLVKEIGEEPNYDEVLEAVKKLV